MQNRWWLLTALAAVVLTLAALLLLTGKGRPRKPQGVALQPPVVATPPPTLPPTSLAATDGGAGCKDADLAPAPALPDANVATLLLLGEPGVRFRVDGEFTFSTVAEPRRFKAGLHTVRAEGEGLEAAELVLRLEPFKPGLVLGLVEWSAAVLAPIDVACEPCGMSESALNVRFDPTKTVEGAYGLTTRSLARGQWRKATETMRGIPPAERSAHFERLLFAAQAQAGMRSDAMAWLDAREGDEGTLWRERKAKLAALAADDLEEEARVATARWNLLTGRFSKLADALGTDAPGPIQSASARFNELSAGYLTASKAKDVLEQEATTQAATDVLTTLVRELRRLKPADCAWQTRVTTSQ